MNEKDITPNFCNSADHEFQAQYRTGNNKYFNENSDLTFSQNFARAGPQALRWPVLAI